MSSPILEVRNLVKQYPAVTAVDGMSFAVPEGICFGLLGPNGAGKTTTIEIMEGILEPTSGEVLLSRRAVGRRFREEAGILFQKTALQDFLTRAAEPQPVPRPVLARPGRGRGDAAVRAREARRRATPASSPAASSSGCCSRSRSINDPRVLFLDEPTTGLDPQARRNFWELVQSIKARRKTIILTTHYMEEAELLCDEIAIMDRGRIIAQGAPRALLREHFAEVLLELPRQELPAGRARPAPAADRSRRTASRSPRTISMRTLRQLMDAHVPLKDLRIRPPNLEDLFLELTGKELRA